MDARLTLKRLTAAGRSAVAALLIEGPGAADLVNGFLYTKKSRVANAPAGLTPGDRLFVGWFQDAAEADTSGRCGEEIVVRCRSKNCVELHCHGGSASIERIESILAARGCELLDWKERIGRRRDDPLQADAILALSRAQTAQTAAALLDQYQGALRRGIESILSSLADGDAATAESRIRSILTWADFGLHLVEPWRVVLAGRPNVGKSTLINALAGFRRAIVHHAPGTTRDVLTVETALEGWPVVLADTAGLRAAEHAIERAGVRLAEEQLRSADLVLLIFDASSEWTDEDEKLGRQIASALIVHNKIDLCEESRLDAALRDRPRGIAVSALTGKGIEQLAVAIGRRLVPQGPPPLTAVPFSSRQTAALRAALMALGKIGASEDSLFAAHKILCALVYGK